MIRSYFRPSKFFADDWIAKKYVPLMGESTCIMKGETKMNKTNAKVALASMIAGVLAWIACFIAVLLGGYDTLQIWAGLLLLTLGNYIVIDECFDEAMEVIFSKEESN